MAEILKKDKIRVRMYTDAYKIEGEIPTHEGYRGRLSDMMNDGKNFLNLSNVTIYSLANDREVLKSNFLCFSKSYILFISPIEG